MVDDERNQCAKGQATVNIDRLIVAATPIFSPSAGGRQPCPAVHWGTLAGGIDQGRISASEKAGSAWFFGYSGRLFGGGCGSCMGPTPPSSYCECTTKS